VEVESVDPLDALGRPVSAVLAIDVSNSMRGAPLETALAAATTFLQKVPPTMPVGVLAFAERAVVLAPVSVDRAAATDAIDSIGGTTSQGTALFDAVIAAAGMFDPKGTAQHNVILVTDGRNTTGTGDADAAKAAAIDAGVNVYTIGLAGPTTDEAILRSIAADTGGSYSAISPTQLSSVYAGIADELIHQDVIAYRSKAPFGAAVQVSVKLPAGDASAAFLAPGLGSVSDDGAQRAEGPLPIEEPLSMAVIVGLTFLAALGLMALLTDARARRRRQAQLRSRTQMPAGPAWEVPVAVAGSNPSLVPKQIAEIAERSVGARRRTLLSGRLRQAGWSIGAGEFLALVVVAVVVSGATGAILFRPLIGLGAGVVAAIVPFAILSSAAAKRLGRIQAQLADTLMVIASAMRAGHSFLQALDNAAKEIDEPAGSEFAQVLAEVRLGRDIDDAMDALVERVGSTDLEWTVTAIKIQRQVGGNLAEVLETVAKTIRERETLRRQVKVLSAEGRLSMVVLLVLPILVSTYLSFVNPQYLRVLIDTRPGVVILSGAGVLMVVGFIWMRKIVSLDV
jgi:tight adherence protein B